ncbi:MAG: hypothetical protein ACTSPE_06655 [Candidatus Thorarchaeota archaeon]
MDDIIIKVRIPARLEGVLDKIEELVNRETQEVIRKLDVLGRARGCLRTDRTWSELEAELYEDVIDSNIFVEYAKGSPNAVQILEHVVRTAGKLCVKDIIYSEAAFISIRTNSMSY